MQTLMIMKLYAINLYKGSLHQVPNFGEKLKLFSYSLVKQTSVLFYTTFVCVLWEYKLAHFIRTDWFNPWLLGLTQKFPLPSLLVLACHRIIYLFFRSLESPFIQSTFFLLCLYSSLIRDRYSFCQMSLIYAHIYVLLHCESRQSNQSILPCKSDFLYY